MVTLLPVFGAGHRIGAALGFAGVLLTGACSGSSGEPRTLPPISTTPAAATASPTFDEDAALKAATAVVREYFRLLNASTSLATAKLFESLMTAKCECREVAGSTRQVAKDGNHYFGRTTITKLSPALVGSDAATVLVEYDYSRSGIADSSGQVITSSPPRHQAAMTLRLSAVDGRWLIQELIYVREGEPA